MKKAILVLSLVLVFSFCYADTITITSSNYDTAISVIDNDSNVIIDNTIIGDSGYNIIQVYNDNIKTDTGFTGYNDTTKERSYENIKCNFIVYETKIYQVKWNNGNLYKPLQNINYGVIIK